MSQRERRMQFNDQEGVEFGQKPRGERKSTNRSKLNLFNRTLMMLFEPNQVSQSHVRHLQKHFMSMADLTILRIPISLLYIRVNFNEIKTERERKSQYAQVWSGVGGENL